MSKQVSQRIHSMDAIRAIAMLLGIVLHACIAYRLFPNDSWPVDDQIHSAGYDYLYIFIHSFRMQLFYLIAGFFARLLYLKIGRRSFIKHRFRRILIPFVVGTVLIVPLSLAPFLYYQYWTLHPYQPFITDIAATLHDVARWKGFAHLWFLYYLLLYYATVLVLLWIKKRVDIFTPALHWLCKKGFSMGKFSGILLVFIPVCLILCFYPGLPVEPYTGIRISWPQYFYYGFFFFSGYVIHYYHVRNLGVLEKNGIPFLVIGTVLTFPVYYLFQWEDVSVPMFFFIRLLAAVHTTTLVFGWLGFFIRFLKAENYVLRYISDASYWMYLIHLPLVAGMQVLFIGSLIPAAFRFWIINIVTISFSLITYELFVRYTGIGKILNGPRERVNFKKLLSLNKVKQGVVNIN